MNISKSGMPWEGEASGGKYSYHPGGDPNATPKDAPSAINVVVIPDVNLPKVCGMMICPSERSIGSKAVSSLCAVYLPFSQQS